MDVSHICTELQAWAVAQPAIRRVWLFGSRARGNAGDNSDLDIALEVIPASDETPTDCWFEHSAQWRSELASRFPFTVQLELLDWSSTPTITAGISSGSVLAYERAT